MSRLTIECGLEETKYIGRSSSAVLGERRAHRRPPAPRHAARSRPSEPPSIRTRRFRRRSPICSSRVAERLAPRLRELRPSRPPPRPARPRTRPASGPRPAGGQSARAQPQAQLVPLDLVGDERRDQVVEVRRRGEQHGHRAVAVVVPAPPPGGRLERRPVVERADAVAREDLGLLAHHDHARRRRPRRAAGGSSTGTRRGRAPPSRRASAGWSVIERCEGSSTRSSVSPLERSSVVYVRW